MKDKDILSEKSIRVDETIRLWHSGYRIIKPAPLAQFTAILSGVLEPIHSDCDCYECRMAWKNERKTHE